MAWVCYTTYPVDNNLWFHLQSTRLWLYEQVYKYQHKLTCQYRRHHPMFYISPLKEEEFYLKPRIVIYHDSIYPSEISIVKELATPRVCIIFNSLFLFFPISHLYLNFLKFKYIIKISFDNWLLNSVLLFLILQLNRATVQNSVTGQLETASYRVSKRWVHMSIPFHVGLWYESGTSGSTLIHWYYRGIARVFGARGADFRLAPLRPEKFVINQNLRNRLNCWQNLAILKRIKFLVGRFSVVGDHLDPTFPYFMKILSVFC